MDALVVAGLSRYPASSISEIHERIGTEIPKARLKRCLAQLVTAGTVAAQGSGCESRYALTAEASP